MKSFLIGLALCALGWPGSAHAGTKSQVVSKGNRFEIKKVLKEEGTTVVLFMQDTSVMEQQFLTELESHLADNPRVALEVVRLKDVQAPAAQQYTIQATPTAVVYDRFGRELARTSQTEEIRLAVRKGQLMARIKWIDEDDPKAAEVYGAPPEALKRGLAGKTPLMRSERRRSGRTSCLTVEFGK